VCHVKSGNPACSYKTLSQSSATWRHISCCYFFCLPTYTVKWFSSPICAEYFLKPTLIYTYMRNECICREGTLEVYSVEELVAVSRVARWHNFKPTILIWENFGGTCYGIIGLFYGHLVYFSRFGMLHQE
jgi:hypothetical protein